MFATVGLAHAFYISTLSHENSMGQIWVAFFSLGSTMKRHMEKIPDELSQENQNYNITCNMSKKINDIASHWDNGVITTETAE